jgi:predicted HTH domain antitoxin
VYTSTLELIYDDFGGWLDGLATELLKLPPEARFTESIEVFEEHLTREFGSPDAFESQLPNWNEERSKEFSEELLERVLRRTLEEIWYVRDPAPSLLVAVGVVGVQYGLRNAQTMNEQSRSVVLSSTLAYFSRLYHVAESGDGNAPSEDLWRDTARLIYHVERAVDGESETIDDPESEDLTELKTEIRRLGAVIAYSRLDISVGRGAELAGVSHPAFRELLEQSDVTPRFGPSDADDLFDGALGDDESSDDST